MDKSIVVVEDSHRTNDSVASASKSLGSLVQINSIAIDISSAMEEIESPAHEHFSIRGFVAGMRKKDWKTCLPFASEGVDGDLVDNLPPLFVPRYRWWQCSNCIPDTATERSAEEMAVAGRSDAGASSCQNFDGEKNGLFLHSRENIGNKLGSRDYGDGEDNDPSEIILSSKQCCIEGHKATACKFLLHTAIVLAIPGSKDKTDVRDKEAGTCADMQEANTFHIKDKLNNIADTSDMVHVAVRPSCIVDEPENASSGSDGTFSALPHRRKPKLRSLADILVEERNPTIENSISRSASSSGMQVICTGTEAVLGPQFELDVPAEIAKASRSPLRKRKVSLEEDRGPLGAIYPSGVAKRFSGLMLDAEKKCRRVEISDSESEGNASTKLDLRLGAKTERIKLKKSKALDINKKMRQTHTEGGTVPRRELPKINALCSENAQKHAAAPLGEMGVDFRSSLSGQQIERISNISKSKRPEIEANHDPLMPPSKSIVRDFNIKGKVTLDLSLNSFADAEKNSNNQASYRQHRVIPDLNEAFPNKTTMMQEKQLPTLSEKRSLPLQKTLDVSASCSKETTRDGKRQLGVSAPQTTDNNIEHGGASDDIPMEIVELLAKNQLERTLGNSTRQINNSTRGYPALYVDGRPPGMMNFPLANRRNGVTVGNGNRGDRQNIPVNFPQLNNYPFDTSKPEESQFRLCSSFPPSQQRKTQYSSSSSILTGPRPSAGPAGAELLWPPRRENVPFHLSIPQNHSIQQNSMSMCSFSDQRHKGKTISDIKDVKEKRAVHDAAVHKEGRIGASSTSVGCLDPYSNETIPAMQLLSLMDQGIVSGSSFKVGPKSFLDKPFSPCDHHPRLNGKENQRFLGGPFFSQNSHSKDFSGLPYGDYCSVESSKKASTYLQGAIPPEVRNSKAIHLEGSSNLVSRAARSNSSLEVCTLNRNPADFSFPGARNGFTISARDLKFRKRNATKEKSRSVNVEGKKRQRVRKDASRKECSRK